ncbi:MAG: LysM peptidoglycan-binding domain-containing protein [Sandaracinaceae bacterium]|nr:LysM peptidoglycan-binding domain-containing protein [Sandaracinaceae bacterium]
MRSGFAVALCASLLVASSAAADGATTVIAHVVRPGETLASIAERYYGDPRREAVLVMENGLNTQGGAAIVVGLRLDIPTVSYHRVAAGETWTELAEHYYGDTHRSAALIEANGGTPTQPDVGAEILIPYPLRHVAGQHDTLSEVAQLYFGRTEAVTTLRRFNRVRGNRLQRGQIILVPLSDLVLSDEGKRLVAAETGHAPSDGSEVRALQARIDGELPVLREHVHRGRFTEAVALANRLLGTGVLTGNQIVTIHRELATAYVALNREDLAVEAFREVIARQPDAELDSVRTSPRVLAAFRLAHQARPAARAAAPTPAAGNTPASTSDAGAH